VRLDPRFRGSLYAAFTLLTVTGVVWLLADWRKDPLAPDLWQEIAPLMLMLHGGGAMATLMLLGALVPLHVRRAWRSGRNRRTGPMMVAVNAVLIATAFGLYYAGSDTLRPWISDLHTVVGIALPLALLVHVWRGRRTRQPPVA
jgi:cation transport ATPase